MSKVDDNGSAFGPKPLGGWAGEDKFAVARAHSLFSLRFEPIVRGRLEETEDGTTLAIDAELRPAVRFALSF